VGSRVAALEDALASDLAAERGMGGVISGEPALRAVGNPIRIHGQPTRYSAPPLLGEHTGAYVAPSARGRGELA
jgi:crotonobetainyl-CoA:carnitine CoA-transferase CaiB-like acyl-CoA transferase